MLTAVWWMFSESLPLGTLLGLHALHQYSVMHALQWSLMEPDYRSDWVPLKFSLVFLLRSLINVVSLKSKLKLYYDRRSVGQSVLVSGTHLGPLTIFFSFCKIIFRQLWVCWCGTPSLTRGRVCSFQLLLGLASAVVLGSKSRRTHDYILVSQIWDSPILEGPVPVFISPRSRVAQLCP
jgi:hypothetical protein